MHKIKSITAAALIAIAAIGLSAPTASATVIFNVVAGQLTGARNVNVAGTFYDVTFVDGTCEALFSGCDAPADFDFPDIATARIAAQALLDQVFIDISPSNQFDSEPDLTAGCADFSICEVLIPFVRPLPSLFWAFAAENSNPSNITDVVTSLAFPPTLDFATDHGATFARFTRSPPAPIPEPGTWLLFAVGLAILAGYTRRRWA